MVDGRRKRRAFARREPKRSQPKKSKKDKREYADLPRFGRVPLVKVRITDPEGNEHECLDYDPDYEPPLPRGAVRGDVRKQTFCSMCHSPRYFYVDESKTCVQCGRDFVFGASEQKYWYESLKFHFDAVAIRCVACRRRQRTLRALHAQLGEARRRARNDPEDPAGQLELAETLVRFHQRTGEGHLNDAIAAARKALKLWPGAWEALFWEGMAQALSGRQAKAREALTRFVQEAPISRKSRPLLEGAARYLAER